MIRFKKLEEARVSRTTKPRAVKKATRKKTARKVAAKQRSKAPVKGLPKGLEAYGEEREEALGVVVPNAWNPNQMSERKYASLRLDMERNGWVKSQPLLVWATDERNRLKNIIVDGEHRWRAANEVGYKRGPMVFLHGITKKQAMELTIKLDNNRGKFDSEALATLLRVVVPQLKTEDPALTLGLTQSEMNKALALPPVRLDNEEDNETKPERKHLEVEEITSKNSANKMVPLYISGEVQAEFNRNLKRLQEHYSTDNITETVLAVVEESQKELA